MIGIYRIFHKDTQKSYIGKSINIHGRMFNHFHSQTIREAKSLLAKDIKKHGKDMFQWEVIEHCETEAELDNREEFWIYTLDPIHPNGYNLRYGGSYGKIAKTEKENIIHDKKQLPLFQNILST